MGGPLSKPKAPSHSVFAGGLKKKNGTAAITPALTLIFAWTTRAPFRKTFHGVTDEGFNELADEQRLPEPILRTIAHYERDYIEGNHNVRWEAFVRTYLPRFLYRFLC